MGLIFSTDFSGHSDYTNLQDGPGWTKHPLSTINLYVFGGRAVNGSSGGSVYLRPEVPASSDQSVAADIYAEDYGTETGQNGFVVARFDPSVLTGYVGGRHDGIWKVGRLNAGAFTFFGSQTTDYYHVAAKRCRLEVTTEGANVRVKLFRGSETTPVAEHLDTSPITTVGRVGIRLFNAFNKLDNFQADTIEASGGATDLSLADSTHAHTADNIALSVLGTLVVQDATHAHSADNITLTATANGTITIPAVRDWETGNLKTGQAGVQVDIRNIATGALVVRKTGQTTHATTGVCVVTDALIIAGTTYEVVTRFADGSRGMWDYLAS